MHAQEFSESIAVALDTSLQILTHAGHERPARFLKTVEAEPDYYRMESVKLRFWFGEDPNDFAEIVVTMRQLSDNRWIPSNAFLWQKARKPRSTGFRFVDGVIDQETYRYY